MRESAGKNTQTCGKIPAHVRDFLRRRAPGKTAQIVENDCGAAGFRVPARTVERWLEGTSAPSADHFCALIATYGLDLLAGLVPGAGWFEAARRAQRAEELQARRAALEAEFSREGL